MAIRPIAVRGDEILTKKCKPVKEVTERVEILAQDMIETMIDADGVGLAAPQVSVMKRMFVCRPHLEEQEKIYVMINPEILLEEGEQENYEGCLSVPGYVGIVKRPEKITVRFINLEKEICEETFEGFAATVISHENDHLDGVVYVDKAEEVLTNEELEELMEAALEEDQDRGEED